MSAVRARGVCPRWHAKVRFRSRKAAVKGLDQARVGCRANGMPPALHPAVVYRCWARSTGGCGGWHIACDRDAVRAFFAGDDAALLHQLPAEFLPEDPPARVTARRAA